MKMKPRGTQKNASAIPTIIPAMTMSHFAANNSVLMQQFLFRICYWQRRTAKLISSINVLNLYANIKSLAADCEMY